MQKNNVIKPSESPWASPVVLVRKRDGTLRFCVDYRAEFISLYLDDVIVFSETLMDHINHLKAVFEHLKKAGFMLNLKKCKVMCNEVEYLGHVVTPHGLKPNNRNLDAVKNFLPPTNLKQLQQFLKLTSYYRHFIPGYAEIAYPLHVLTRKGALFEWTADCEAAFETLRPKLL